MNSPPPPASRPTSRRALVIAAFCALIAAACGAALWISMEKQKSSVRMIELQEIEIESLRTALEAETLISRGSMQQLRRIAAGRSFSAFATLARGESQLVAFWSDDLAAGFLLLPAEMAGATAPALRIFIHETASDDPFAVTTTQSASDRILGFHQPADRLPPSRITVQFSPPGTRASPQSTTADWVR